MSDDYVTQDYLDERLDRLREHVISRLDKLETAVSTEHRRDIDRIEKKSNLHDIGVLIGTIVAAVLGVLGISR